jgi:hypothetical protein
MRIDDGSDLFKEIPYKINSIIDIGIWVNKLITNNEGGELNAQ